MRFKFFLFCTQLFLNVRGDVETPKFEEIDISQAEANFPHLKELMTVDKDEFLSEVDNVDMEKVFGEFNQLSEDKRYLTEEEIQKKTDDILSMVGDNPEIRSALKDSSDTLLTGMRDYHNIHAKPQKRLIGIILAPIKAALTALRFAIQKLVKMVGKLASKALQVGRKLMRSVANQLSRAKSTARNALGRTKNVMNKMKTKVTKAARGAKNFVRSAKNRMMDGVKRVVKIMGNMARKGKEFVTRQARNAKNMVKRAITKVKAVVRAMKNKLKAAGRKAVQIVKNIKGKVTRAAGTVKRAVVRAFKSAVALVKKAVTTAQRMVSGVIRAAKKIISGMKRVVTKLMKAAAKKVQLIKKAVGGAMSYATAGISAMVGVVGAVGGAIFMCSTASATSGMTSGFMDKLQGKDEPTIVHSGGDDPTPIEYPPEKDEEGSDGVETVNEKQKLMEAETDGPPIADNGCPVDNAGMSVEAEKKAAE